MTNQKSGDDLVSLLRDLGCTEASSLRGQDVDWLWETKAGGFMDWICNNVTQENLLTEEELKKWESFPKNDILEGEKLSEALNDIADEEVVDDDNVIENIREELEAREMSLSELDIVKNQLRNEEARIALKINQDKLKIQKSETNLMGKQQQLLHLNSEIDDSLVKLQKAIHEVFKKSDPMFISEMDLSSLMKENDQVKELLTNFIRLRFGDDPANRSNNTSDIELIRGRDVEDFETLITEIERLRFSIQGKLIFHT